MVRRLFLLALPIAALLLAPAVTESRAQTASEEELKAAYLLNFALFVQWPSGDRSTFTVCQYGSDTLGAGADALGRRYLRGKPIVTRRVNHRELADCAILYIAASDGPRIRDLVLAVRGTGVLTVSDAPGAALEGAVIGLSMTDQRIVFDVNVKEARRNNLVISAKLLSLAQAVVEAP